jgi:hypothetical protein
MRFLLLGVELANVVTVQCLHDADPRAQAMPVAPVLLDQISRQPGLLDDRGPLQDRDG